MKHRIQLIIFIFHLAISTALAVEPENFEKPQLESELNKLNELENYVLNNEGVTFEKLETENPELVQGFSSDSGANFIKGDNSDLFGIPPFLWGCCLGVVGILLVYIFTDNDKVATKKAVVGCAVAVGTYVVFYVVLIILGVTASSTTYYY